MLVDGKAWRSIWPLADGTAVAVIDQTKLPFAFVVARLETLADAARAIAEMLVRGAPLIGATAAYGFWLGMREAADDMHLAKIASMISHFSRAIQKMRSTASSQRSPAK